MVAHARTACCWRLVHCLTRFFEAIGKSLLVRKSFRAIRDWYTTEDHFTDELCSIQSAEEWRVVLVNTGRVVRSDTFNSKLSFTIGNIPFLLSHRISLA